jgi:hypothetical protein
MNGYTALYYADGTLLWVPNGFDAEYYAKKGLSKGCQPSVAKETVKEMEQVEAVSPSEELAPPKKVRKTREKK